MAKGKVKEKKAKEPKSTLAKPTKAPNRFDKMKVKKQNAKLEDTSSSVALIDPSKGANSFSMTRVGINYMAPAATFEMWAEFGGRIRMVRDGLQWVAGDWMNLGKERFDEQYSQELNIDQWTPETLSNYANVCSAFEFPRRRGQLSFGHHAVVYKLSIDEQDKLLDQAIEKGWSEKELREHAAEFKKKGKGKKKVEFEAGEGPTYIMMTLKVVEGSFASVCDAVDQLIEKGWVKSRNP